MGVEEAKADERTENSYACGWRLSPAVLVSPDLTAFPVDLLLPGAAMNQQLSALSPMIWMSKFLEEPSWSQVGTAALGKQQPWR